ncbi:hypothetical protein AMTR_s00028p00204190 [Amborella trichopoda]|uniref:Uncharacterized protein n=1 Tax=Amborella trichopoda TaxID=13333 RepID=W1PSF3_AMBTC|nr:hypothetical protein AMTR_s00028p00204190 [Amborella trichopoda]
MDQRLLNACKTGDYDALLKLVQQDDNILDSAAALTFETSLHLVCRYGHVEMAKVILRLRPLTALAMNGQEPNAHSS